MRAPSPGTRLRSVVLDGHRVRFADRSPDGPQVGPPMLLLMGIGASMDMWGPLEDELVARGRRVITCDMPGSGSSPAPVPPLRMRGLAQIAVDILDLVDVDRADVLGVSFGGALAQQVARTHPERVRRLVLAATAPGLLGVPPSPRVLMHMSTPLRYWHPRYARRIAGVIYGGRARTDPHAVLKGRFARPPSAYGYGTQLFAIWGWTSLPWLALLQPRTLVMAGDDDPIIPLANGRLLAHLIPDAELEVIRGGGHLFLLEEAAHSADLIEEFLHDRAGSRAGRTPRAG